MSRKMGICIKYGALFYGVIKLKSNIKGINYKFRKMGLYVKYASQTKVLSQHSSLMGLGLYPMPSVWFILGISTLTVWFLYKLYSLKLRNRQLIEAHETYSDRMVESELKTLRSQVNPHFLSNSLVGLQQLILEGRSEKAIDFISSYSKVMRNILEQSEFDFIQLDKKLQTLRQYIELEKLVSHQTIHFNVEIEGLKNSDVCIPSMLLQPLIENSFRHAFNNHDVQDKVIRLLFKFESRLTIELTDNGSGLSRQASIDHTSTSLDTIRKRMALYSKKYQTDYTIEVGDNLDENGYVCGTKVVLQVPYFYSMKHEEKNLYLSRKNQSHHYRR